MESAINWSLVLQRAACEWTSFATGGEIATSATAFVLRPSRQLDRRRRLRASGGSKWSGLCARLRESVRAPAMQMCRRGRTQLWQVCAHSSACAVGPARGPPPQQQQQRRQRQRQQ